MVEVAFKSIELAGALLNDDPDTATQPAGAETDDSEPPNWTPPAPLPVELSALAFRITLPVVACSATAVASSMMMSPVALTITSPVACE